MGGGSPVRPTTGDPRLCGELRRKELMTFLFRHFQCAKQRVCRQVMARRPVRD